jgi:hypothetical protein
MRKPSGVAPGRLFSRSDGASPGGGHADSHIGPRLDRACSRDLGEHRKCEILALSEASHAQMRTGRQLSRPQCQNKTAAHIATLSAPKQTIVTSNQRSCTSTVYMEGWLTFYGHFGRLVCSPVRRPARRPHWATKSGHQGRNRSVPGISVARNERGRQLRRPASPALDD